MKNRKSWYQVPVSAYNWHINAKEELRKNLKGINYLKIQLKRCNESQINMFKMMARGFNFDAAIVLSEILDKPYELRERNPEHRRLI